ncbi:flagellar basal body P-ring biosynthesis protein FlgA [Pseudovibrio axinellae]|uniref:Flagella basal body P-ring formation protein FlgA n=1 Tax=Pseudovibrio axinellae TaxID=989403 RepID=A0A161X945_9HYPH|nr:flagellar basal body P-ring formation chaperone FlgA [Pseudovibrio axinellae]KZL08455.1 flagellar basal body P-ring biosynthesis protein FlgA [Pseudovibrio axinellae]SEP74430.1 flagella basal body P-ring formation protein FlgA [Pseudovibrio axinellae]
MNATKRFIRAAVLLCCVSLSSTAAPAAGGREVVKLPVPAMMIYPGDTIEAGMLREHGFYAKSVAQLSVVHRMENVVGLEARRTLFPGKPIPNNAVQEPVVVKRGSSVLLVFKENGLEIRAIVEAQESGSIGTNIRVRNPDTGLSVLGKVQEDGSLLAEGE